jgi:Domain of unknown function (DUF4351)
MMQLSPLFLEKIQAAEQQGEARGEMALILRQLARRLGNVSVESEARIKGLPLAQLEELGEALLDFGQMTDLVSWLDVVGEVSCSENRD